MRRARGHSPFWRILRLIWTLGCAIGLATALAPAATAASPVTMKVTPGLDGWTRPGDWLPLNVDLTNDGADLDAQIVVDAGTGASLYGKGPSSYRTEYVASASLPRHSHKLVQLSVPFDSRSQNVTVKLVDKKDTLAQQTVAPTLLETNQLLVGILSAQPRTAARGLGSLATGRRRAVVPVWLDADSFPGRPEMLGSLDLLIVDDFPTADLSDAQRQTIAEWVAQGGTLVAVGGGDWRRTLSPLPNGLLPVALTADGPSDASEALARFASLTAGPTGPLDLSQATLRDGQALAASGSLPLVVVADRGLGRVAYVAADLMADPLASWSEVGQLWQAVFAEALPAGGALTGQPNQQGDPRLPFLSQLSNALSNFPSLDPPSLDTLAWLLIGYILLIGVVSYVALGRLRRRDLGWITVPVIAIAFTVGTYGIAQRARGSDLIASTVSLVRLVPGGPASAVSAIGTFAPGNADDQLTIDSPSLPLTLPSPYSGGMGGGSAGPQADPLGMTIQEGDHQQSIALSSAAPWALRGVWLRHAVDNAGQIDAVLRPEGQHLRGTVTNHTRFALADCIVLAGDSVVHLGVLPVGSSAKVDLDLSVNGAPNLNGPKGIFQVYNFQSTNQGAGAARDPNAARKQPVFVAWAQAPASIGGRGSPPIYFAGWSDQRLVPTSRESQPVPGPALDLITQPLSLDLTGAFDVGPGLIPGRILDVSGASPVFTGPTGLNLDRDAVALEFSAPPPDRLQSLGFHVATFNNTIQGSVPFAAAVFDWSTGTWQPVTPSSIKHSTPTSIPPSRPVQGGPIAVPVPPPFMPAVGGSQVSVARAVAVSAGGEYDISLGDLPGTRYVSPTGAVRLRLSSPDGSVPISSVSLIATGTP
ncbi:MAG TPA: hypothetical protein VNL16_15710 [Chloroflexota bacterium]|nr:hypothetical protein [Chloroflexota bacterium]